MSKEKTFETTLAEATAVIEKLEKGEQSLEALIKEHKKGRALINQCFEMLEKAEDEFAKNTQLIEQEMKEQEK